MSRPLKRAGIGRRVGMADNLRWLDTRTLAPLRRPTVVRRVAELMGSGGTAICVGTGGSLAVAQFVAILLALDGRWISHALRPRDYLEFGSQTDRLLIFSYSGATTDLEPVIAHAQTLGTRRVSLVTASPHPKLGEVLGANDEVLAYASVGASERGERGFVSMAATTAPCALFTAAAEGSRAVREAVARAGRAADADMVGGARLSAMSRVGVLGGGLATPAVVDLESKLTEADLAIATLHEPKDFSHGRFMASLKCDGPPIIWLGIADEDEYEKALHRAFIGARLDLTILRSADHSMAGALELLLRTQRLAAAIATARGRDISRPSHIPDDGLALYRHPLVMSRPNSPR